MNDFQKRNRGSGNDKKFDPAKRTYPSNTASYNPQYWNADKQGGKDNRRKVAPNRKMHEMEQQTNILAEIVTDMKGLLESIEQSNKRLTEIEERQTAALEKIAEFLTGRAEIPTPRKAEKIVVKEDVPETDVETEAEEIIAKEDVSDDTETIPPGKPDDDTKKMIIRLIQKRHENGLNYTQIASQFADENIPTFSGKGKWHPQTIQKIGRLSPDDI